MGAKRMSVSSSKRPVGRPPKAAKVTSSAEQDKFAPVKDLMGEYCQLTQSCFDMLSAALPLALKTDKAERHAFETSVIKAFEAALEDADKQCNAAVEAASERIKEHEDVKANSAANLQAAEQAAEKAVEEKKAATGFHDEKQAAQAAASAASKAAEQEAEASQKQVQDQTAAKEAFDAACAEVLPALKDGTFAPKDWRLRQKAIGRLSQLLQQSDAPESLVAGAQVAFKEKPEARGEFAVKTVEVTEACLKNHSEALAQGIAEASDKAEALRGAAAASAEAAKAAQTELEAAQEDMITADNTWVELDSEVLTLKNAIKAFGQTDKALEAELSESRASLERFHGLARQFEALRDQVPEAAPEASAEPAAAAEVAPAEADVPAPVPAAEGEQA